MLEVLADRALAYVDYLGPFQHQNTRTILSGGDGGRPPIVASLAQDQCSGAHPVCSTSSLRAGSSVVGLVVIRLASQRVSAKVSSIMATKRVMGSARNAPGPPSSHAQTMKDKNTIVGEMLSPRPIISGESTFSASTLMTITPAMTRTARVTPNSARANTTAGVTASTSPMYGTKLRKKVRIPQSSGKSTPNKNSMTVTPAPVTRLTIARSPNCRTTL